MDYSSSDILCIHYYYPPIRSGGVIRNYYFSKAFAKRFRKVHVITTSNADVMDQEQMDIPENVIVYKSKTKDFRSVKKGGNHIAMNAKNSRLYKVLWKLKKTLPFHFYLDEGGITYIKNSVALAEKVIDENPITHLYSSFMPYADHKISSTIKSKVPHVKWIADFRDLQYEPIYKNIYFPRWNTKQERAILANADLVTTISQGLVNSMQGLHSKIISVPRGVELSEKRESKDDVFRIAYTGSLFFNYRDGLFFVRAFAQSVERLQIGKDKVKFVYAGREEEQWISWFNACGIDSYFESKGFVSRKESQLIQQESNALLLLTSSTEEHQGVFTGKLFEYLESRNPIINVLNGVEDKEFENLFEELEAGRIFYPEDSAALVDYICSMINSYNSGESHTLTTRAIQHRNAISWDSRAQKMLDEL